MLSKSTYNSNNQLNPDLLSDNGKYKEFFIYPIAENLYSSIKKAGFSFKDPDNNVYLITGESRPPDVREFYDQILSWLQDFSLYIIGPDSKKDPVIFNFNFEYFNSSSGKLILDICKLLAGLRLKGINIIVKWYHEKEDGDMLEVGKEMSRIVKFPFEYIASDLK